MGIASWSSAVPSRAGRLSLGLITAVVMTACGQDTPRKTTQSTQLTGLWRTVLNARTDQIDSTLGFSYTMVDNGGTLAMVPCAGRGLETLTRTGMTVGPVIIGDAQIVNNDTLRIANEYGTGDASKMSVSPTFDMGQFDIRSSPLGTGASRDLCSNTVSARYLGVSVLETVTAYGQFNGQLVGFELSKVGKFSATSYTVGTEVTQVTVALESAALQSRYRDTRVTLKDGTLKITRASNVWLQGEVSAKFPDGALFDAVFKIEKP